ncbi:MAG: hypothetical protein CL687_04705 [Candidatus Pelagibacter sp.]|nr:hypothetical protein [Candidatus Pelagibacter sp.]OUW23428.1 MAG: hypothetical protein CBD34_03100 [Rickettsiales bacterium TMED174]|tara:strand:- start:1558 stop:1950 length:393 start_codon:yes stop_codon:yes gene_type:complete
MSKLNKDETINVTALMIHASKIDDNFSEKEKKLIINFIKNNCEEKNDEENIFSLAEKLENNSNQLLTYTKIIKEKPNEFKTQIIEELWKIIISDENIDQFESNFMRRLCGLIYFSDKSCGEIKLKVKNRN